MNEEILNRNKIDALLITNMSNVYYFSKFNGSTAMLLVSKNKKYILTDDRYLAQAKEQCPDFEVVPTREYLKPLNEIIKNDNLKDIGFEFEDVSLVTYDNLISKLDANMIRVSLKDERMSKQLDELNSIKKACEIVDETLAYFKENFKLGMSEKDVYKMLYKKTIDLDSEGFSFEPIIVSGPRGCMCHAGPSDRVLEVGDLLTIDFGVKYNGYCSDITRTFGVKEVTDPKLLEIYEIVKEANLLAIKNIKCGMKAIDLDKIARDYITSKGYGQYFTHSLGHGVGIDIHEEPFVSSKSEAIIKENCIITIEPGIYIEGYAGVRIEDDVFVTKDGYEILTKTDKELYYIG